MPQTDAATVALARDGDNDAFRMLVERHSRAVYRVAHRMTGNAPDAEDVVQETFLKAYRQLGRFESRANFSTWLHRIAVNTCLNRLALKTPRTEPINEMQHVDTRSESASERLLRDERAVKVRAALARLPKKQRAALILRTYQDLSHQEVAAVLGTSVGAAKANVFHALQNLKKLLGDV